MQSIPRHRGLERDSAHAGAQAGSSSPNLDATPIRSCCSRLISERTKAAFAIRKASSGKLGNPSNIRHAGEIGRAALVAEANDHARALLPLLRTLHSEGAITIGAVTRSLNQRKIPTARGSRWHVSSLANLLARAQKLEAAP